MATKKPYSRHTNSADRRKYEGTPVTSTQQNVKPGHKPGTHPPAGTQPPADTQPSPTGTQPAPATPKPSGDKSTK